MSEQSTPGGRVEQVGSFLADPVQGDDVVNDIDGDADVSKQRVDPDDEGSAMRETAERSRGEHE